MVCISIEEPEMGTVQGFTGSDETVEMVWTRSLTYDEAT